MAGGVEPNSTYARLCDPLITLDKELAAAAPRVSVEEASLHSILAAQRPDGRFVVSDELALVCRCCRRLMPIGTRRSKRAGPEGSNAFDPDVARGCRGCVDLSADNRATSKAF
jgi:hypothetical protein